MCCILPGKMYWLRQKYPYTPLHTLGCACVVSSSQVVMFFQLLAVYLLLPSVALAYDAYRAEEQVFK